MTPSPEKSRHALPRQLLWFVALWVGGVLAVTLVGLVIRAFLMP